MLLSIAAPKTPGGRVYRLSPNEEALPRHFVIGNVVGAIELTAELRQRMKLNPRSSQTVCPYSGTVADDEEFLHPDDRKAAIETVRHAALEDMRDAFSDMLKDVFRPTSGRGSAITISAKVAPRAPEPRPRFFRRDLMRQLICDHCGRDYGVFAIALFCPDCGAPNLRLHFSREAELVEDQVALAAENAEANEELAYRLMGNAHEDVLTALEATLKTTYLYGIAQTGGGSVPKVGNEFQNIEKARKRFLELALDPFGRLSESDLEELQLNIQKRHIIGHNLGIIDDRFANHDGDAKLGETVELVGEDIRRFAAIGQIVVDRLDGWLCGTPSPTIGASAVSANPRARVVDAEDPKGLKSLNLGLSLLARKIGLWVAERSLDGRNGYVDPSSVVKAFANVSEKELEGAVAELVADGYVEGVQSMGRGLQHFQPTLDLFITFDDLTIGRNTMSDAAELTALVLAGGDFISAEMLFTQSAWELRRFNPAFERVVAELPSNVTRRTLGSQFVVTGFHLSADARVKLRRFLASVKP